MPRLKDHKIDCGRKAPILVHCNCESNSCLCSSCTECAEIGLDLCFRTRLHKAFCTQRSWGSSLVGQDVAWRSHSTLLPRADCKLLFSSRSCSQKAAVHRACHFLNWERGLRCHKGLRWPRIFDFVAKTRLIDHPDFDVVDCWKFLVFRPWFRVSVDLNRLQIFARPDRDPWETQD